MYFSKLITQRVVSFQYQNLRRCQKCLFKIMHFILSFQILAEVLPKCYQNQRPTCWKLTIAWGKKAFYECVACVCLTFGSIFLVIALFMAIGFLMGVETVSFALPIDLYKSLWNSGNG